MLRRSGRHGPIEYIPNATDEKFFDIPSPSRNTSDVSLPVIGYVGAIEDWFDADLLIALAERRPEWRFELAGYVNVIHTRLRNPAKRPDNIICHGEIPYGDVPKVIENFDVGIIPFKNTDLTHFTDPVKVYEYLASGRPVVSTVLPELNRFEGLVEQADDVNSFEKAIENALNDIGPDACLARRMAVIEDTWPNRAGRWNALIRVARQLSRRGR
jgi:glycosyltransferase involved in cell wall biosynthesis